MLLTLALVCRSSGMKRYSSLNTVRESSRELQKQPMRPSHPRQWLLKTLLPESELYLMTRMT